MGYHRRMDLRALRYFVRAAEAGSISAAARQLRVAQPALTRHIRNLERELGVSLFERTARGLLLSDAARQLLSDGREILSAVESAKGRAQGFADLIAGEVTVGITPSVSMILTNPLLRNMQRQAPTISVRIVDSMTGNGSEWLEWLRSEHLDFAVMYDLKSSNELKSVPLLLEDLHLVGKLEKPVGAEISLTSMAQYPLVLPSAIHPLRKLVDRAARERGVPLRIVREADSLLEVKSLIRWEGLYSILSPCAIWEERAHGELLAVRIADPPLTRRVNLVSFARGERRTAVQLTEDVIRSTASELTEFGHWDAVLANVKS
jgi:LysR family transcriptional regulator, nitrogen assimilation regulatory protein